MHQHFYRPKRQVSWMSTSACHFSPLYITKKRHCWMYISISADEWRKAWWQLIVEMKTIYERTMARCCIWIIYDYIPLINNDDERDIVLACSYIYFSFFDLFLTFFKWLSLKLTMTEKHDKHKYSSCEWRKSYIFIHMFSCHRCQHVNIPALPNSNKTTPFPKALMALQTAIMLQMERPGG